MGRRKIERTPEYLEKRKEQKRVCARKAYKKRVESEDKIRTWREEHPEEAREYSKRYYAENKERESIRAKKKNLGKYGLTLEDYNRMFEEQEGKCLICGKHQTELSTRLHVDHDHETGKVRGLLCYNCNSVLGYAKDNPEILKIAMDYLNAYTTTI